MSDLARLECNSPNKLKSLYKIIPENEVIEPKSIVAYSMQNGTKELLIDSETHLISSNILDAVSDEIAIEFGKMLDLEFDSET